MMVDLFEVMPCSCERECEKISVRDNLKNNYRHACWAALHARSQSLQSVSLKQTPTDHLI